MSEPQKDDIPQKKSRTSRRGFLVAVFASLAGVVAFWSGQSFKPLDPINLIAPSYRSGREYIWTFWMGYARWRRCLCCCTTPTSRYGTSLSIAIPLAPSMRLRAG